MHIFNISVFGGCLMNRKESRLNQKRNKKLTFKDWIYMILFIACGFVTVLKIIIETASSVS